MDAENLRPEIGRNSVTLNSASLCPPSQCRFSIRHCEQQRGVMSEAVPLEVVYIPGDCFTIVRNDVSLYINRHCEHQYWEV